MMSFHVQIHVVSDEKASKPFPATLIVFSWPNRVERQNAFRICSFYSRVREQPPMSPSSLFHALLIRGCEPNALLSFAHHVSGCCFHHHPSFDYHSQRQFCQRGFKHVQALRQHLETSSKHMHDCQRCDRSFGSECSREQHCRDSSKHHICEFDGCEVDFETEAALERHEDVAHPRCAECDDVVELDSLTELVHHRDGHHGDGHAARLVSSDELVMFTFSPSALCWAKEDTFVCAELGGGSGGGCRAACPRCGATFGSEGARLMHWESGFCESGVDERRIDYLAGWFVQDGEFICDGKDDECWYACPRCGETFSYASSLVQHVEGGGCDEDLEDGLVGEVLCWLSGRI